MDRVITKEEEIRKRRPSERGAITSFLESQV